MLRLLGIATLLIRPAVWLLLGAAFTGGLLYERANGEARCEESGGIWRGGLCRGLAQ